MDPSSQDLHLRVGHVSHMVAGQGVGQSIFVGLTLNSFLTSFKTACALIPLFYNHGKRTTAMNEI